MCVYSMCVCREEGCAVVERKGETGKERTDGRGRRKGMERRDGHERGVGAGMKGRAAGFQRLKEIQATSTFGRSQ